MRNRRRKAIDVIVVVFLICLSWLIALDDSRRSSFQDNSMRVWFFDVGQGDATFIETPEGKQILIDGGPDDLILAKLGSVMRFWDKTIDAVIITHPDADHISGLVSVFDRYDVGVVYETGLNKNTYIMQALEKAIENENTKHYFVRAGDSFNFGKVLFKVLSPIKDYKDGFIEDANQASLVIKVEYNQLDLLLTGDATVDEEAQFGESANDVDVLKVGHHGSLTSTDSKFLDQTKPEYAVISLGEDNQYNHPHPVVLKWLNDRNIEIYRTDFDGDILLKTNGQDVNLFSAPLPF